MSDTTHVTAGAYVNGRRPLYKKAFLAAVTSDPGSVEFEVTSAAFTASPAGVADITPDQVVNVTGPDPYVRRNWYATVTRSADGTVRAW